MRAGGAMAGIRRQPVDRPVPGLRPRTAGGVTRWSWLGCPACRSVELALQTWLGIPVLPLGRHSKMNGVGRRLAVAPATSRTDLDAFCQSLTALSLSWLRLAEWGVAEARRLATLHDFDAEDVSLHNWQRAFLASTPASVDAYERLLQTKIPAGVIAQ